jgi:hypothetical protein
LADPIICLRELDGIRFALPILRAGAVLRDAGAAVHLVRAAYDAKGVDGFCWGEGVVGAATRRQLNGHRLRVGISFSGAGGPLKALQPFQSVGLRHSCCEHIMTSRHPLHSALQRVDRAEEHFVDLKREVANFRQDHLDSVGIHFDPNPPHRPVEKPPIGYPAPLPIVSILLGEICYNLRSALDYLVFELAKLDSGSVQNGTQFPIDDTPQLFTRHILTRLKGISPPHVTAIERLQPYNGCKWSPILRDISNPDKHRELTSYGRSHIVEIAGQSFFGIVPNSRAKRRAKRPDGVEVEVEFIGQINVLVPLNIPGHAVPVGWPIEEIVEKLISDIRDTLEAFKPEF